MEKKPETPKKMVRYGPEYNKHMSEVGKARGYGKWHIGRKYGIPKRIIEKAVKVQEEATEVLKNTSVSNDVKGKTE